MKGDEIANSSRRKKREKIESSTFTVNATAKSFFENQPIHFTVELNLTKKSEPNKGYLSDGHFVLGSR